MPDLDGLKLGSRLQIELPFLQVIIMTGEKLSSGDEERCSRDGWALIQKPFLVEDLMELVRSRLPMSAAAAGGPTSP